MFNHRCLFSNSEEIKENKGEREEEKEEEEQEDEEEGEEVEGWEEEVREEEIHVRELEDKIETMVSWDAQLEMHQQDLGFFLEHDPGTTWR